MTILIIGAGHAGGSVAANLRQLGCEEPISIVGEEPHLPYQRPPLSKAWLKGDVAFAKPRGTERTRDLTMTTIDHPSDVASAAASGASATERFHADKSPYAAVKDTPPNDRPAGPDILEAVHDTIRRHRVTYDEYNALKPWLIDVGQHGEWPLFLDVWVEHVVEDVATDHRAGNKGSIEGPYYVPGSPELGAKGTVPMRDGEQGTPLVWRGRVTATDGTPLQGKVELWHADDDGYYSQFAPGIPDWNLRGSFSTEREGASKSPRFVRRRTRFRPTDRAES